MLFCLVVSGDFGGRFLLFFFFLVVKVGVPAEMTGDRKLGDPAGEM